MESLVRLTQSHAHGNVSVLHHLLELLEADLAVAVEIGFHDGFVDNLERETMPLALLHSHTG